MHLTMVMVTKKEFVFNETILNVICNFIPHQTVTCDDRDPPWMTSLIKKTNNDKNLFYKRFVKNPNFTNNKVSLISK